MDSSPHVLVVDDDREIRDLLAKFLTKHGCRVTLAADGKDMRLALADRRIDLVVLDLMLPGEDGLSLCRRLRAESDLPVIMLTAMREDIDRILGLEMGADDYLPKPFNPRELLARIRAVLLGPLDAARAQNATLLAGWRLGNGASRCPDGREAGLTGSEFDLLLAFAEQPGES
jgi:two-component system OmpR family response regulator